MKVKQVVIEWEEGGSSIFSQRDGALVNQICELQAHLKQARKEADEANRRYEKLCTNIKNLV